MDTKDTKLVCSICKGIISKRYKDKASSRLHRYIHIDPYIGVRIVGYNNPLYIA
jgi:hypothetical protein